MIVELEADAVKKWPAKEVLLHEVAIGGAVSETLVAQERVPDRREVATNVFGRPRIGRDVYEAVPRRGRRTPIPRASFGTRATLSRGARDRSFAPNDAPHRGYESPRRPWLLQDTRPLLREFSAANE